MKKLFRNIITVLVLAAMLVTSLSGCGTNPSTTLNDNEAEDDTMIATTAESTIDTAPQLTETKAEATPNATEAPKPSETPAPTEEPKTTEAPKVTEAPAATPAPTPAPTQKPAPATPAPTPAPTQKPAETHTHSWTQQTKTVHHDAVTEQVKVVDVAGTDGWDEVTAQSWCICQCGARFASNEAWAAHASAMTAAWEAAGNDVFDFTGHCGSHNEVEYITVHHDGTPEQSHYETRVVKDAWDETVVTGYTCACGATKAA